MNMLGLVTYEKIDEEGLHITRGGEAMLLEVDNVIICAGQTPLRDLQEPLEAQGTTVHLIGRSERSWRIRC